MAALLDIQDLAVDFRTEDGAVHAVKGLSMSIDRGETVALVGESGSGKSVTALSVLQLLPYPTASHPGGSIRLDGQELLGAPASTMRMVRGNRVAMVFQEPMTSLNPLHSVEKQLGETLRLHKGMAKSDARATYPGTVAPGRLGRGRKTSDCVSSRVVWRPAPARHDRHGAGQRAGPVDRRRAHDRAGRHHSGADSATAQTACSAGSTWRCCSSPTI